MKKKLIGAVLALVLFARLTYADSGGEVAILDGVSTNATSAEQRTDRASYIRVQVYCIAAPCAGIVTLQERSGHADSPWFTVATITNPDLTGEYWSIPVTNRMRAQLSSYTTGTFKVILETHSINP